MTPLNHLSQGPGNDKLRELLLWHREEQRKRKAIEACSETKAKMDELEDALSNIVGLNELKLQLRKWAKGMLLDERRRALGLKVGPRKPPHMAFLGNPGTGNLWLRLRGDCDHVYMVTGTLNTSCILLVVHYIIFVIWMVDLWIPHKSEVFFFWSANLKSYQYLPLSFFPWSILP